MTPIKLRFLRWLIRLAVRLHWRGRRAQGLAVHDERVPVAGATIAARVYRPAGAGPFPVLHFFHGGGWVGFDIDTHDPLCRDLCAATGMLVVSFDYRLAPENPFPVPVQDCLATLDWIRDHAGRLGGDPDCIVLCGDSAGGNLAAVVAQQARGSHPGMIKGQVLIYPVTDNCRHAQWPSYESKGGPRSALSHEKMCELWDLYLSDPAAWPAGTRHHPLATPLHVEDLGGSPPALFVLAEEDLLRDEGIAYAERLQRAGVAASVRRYAGQSHGFVGLKPTPAHREAVADIAAWLRALRTIGRGDRT